MTITEFLEARITEDEEAAQESQSYEDQVYETEGWFDCTRVLAECAAKRAIIARFKPEDVKEDWSVEASYSSAVEDCMLDLATVYKDHPDYQQEWAV